jgi:hypothetical protein
VLLCVPSSADGGKKDFLDFGFLIGLRILGTCLVDGERGGGSLDGKLRRRH